MLNRIPPLAPPIAQPLADARPSRIDLERFLVKSGVGFWMNPSLPLFQDAALTTPAADGELVGGVPDAAGSAVVASQTSTARPTYDADGINGHPALLFSGAQYLIANALAAALSGEDKAVSCTWVAKLSNAVSFRSSHFSFGNTSSGNNFMDVQNNFNTDFRARRVSNSGTDLTGIASCIPDLNTHIYTLIFAGQTVTLRIDGVTIMDAVALDVGTMTINTFNIGALVRSTVANQFRGHIGHFMEWPRAISSKESSVVEAFIANEYQVSILRPGDSPSSVVTLVPSGGADDTSLINGQMLTGREVRLSGIFPVTPGNLNIPNGATLTILTPNGLSPVATSLTGKGMIPLYEKFQVTIKGPGGILGDRYVHLGGSANHGIFIQGGANHVISGVDVVSCRDGIYVGASTVYGAAKNITILNNAVSDSRRNNMSVTSSNGGIARGNSFNDANGEAPQAGVDLEPNPGATVINWAFSDCEFSGNTGVGISVDGTGGPLQNVSFIDCGVFGNGSQYAVNVDNTSQFILQGGSVTGGSNMQIHIARSDNLTIEDVQVPAAGGSNGIYFDFDVDTALVDGCAVSNVAVVGVQINHVDGQPECTNVTVRNTVVDGAFYGVWFKAGSTGVLGPGMSYLNCSDSDYVIDPAATVTLL